MANNEALISIILPVYNGQDTICNCIDSVLAQTFENFELVIINDQSPDDSQQFIDQYQSKDPRIVSLKNEINIGHGGSRNRGVRHAKGKYIFNLDPDDSIPPNSLESLFNNIVRYDSDLVKGAYIKEQTYLGKGFGEPQLISMVDKDSPIINTNLYETKDLLSGIEGHWTYLYKSDIAKRNPWPTDLKMGQDAIFITRSLLDAKKITIINDVVYLYKANTLSAMNVFNFRKYIDVLEWRRRVWHILSNAGLKDIGDRFIVNYCKNKGWHNRFFKSLADDDNSLKQLQELCFSARQVFTETRTIGEIEKINDKKFDNLKNFFTMVINGHDEEAIALVLSKNKL